MTEWEPATEAEVALREALRANDQDSYFRILAGMDLLLPVSPEAAAGRAPLGWGTWSSGGRTHVLAFTSAAALQACLAEHAGSARTVSCRELAATWPNLEWWLAVNPGLPIEGYLPSWFVGQLGRGDIRLPHRDPGQAATPAGPPVRAAAAVPPPAGTRAPGVPISPGLEGATPPGWSAEAGGYGAGPPVASGPVRSGGPEGPGAGVTPAGLPIRRAGATPHPSPGGEPWAQPPAAFLDPQPETPVPGGPLPRRPMPPASERPESMAAAAQTFTRPPQPVRDPAPREAASGPVSGGAPTGPPGPAPGAAFTAGPPDRTSVQSFPAAEVDDPAGPPPSPEAAGPQPPPEAADLPLDEFEPANEVERDLLAAAGGGSTDVFLSTLLLATVLVPVAPGARLDSRPGDPDFAWHTEVIDGERYLVVFTSPDRLAEHHAEPVHTRSMKFFQLIRDWPDPEWAFAVNPGTPVGATLPGAQVVALAAWAAEAGLGSDDGPDEETDVDRPARPGPSRPAEVRQQPIVMQKTVRPDHVEYLLERGYDRVAGFVHRASEVEHLRSPAALYAALGLGYAGSPFEPDAKEAYLLRWPAHRPSLYRIPYGGPNESAMRAMDGWVIERPPFRGNGFAPAEHGDVIAEFKVDSTRLPHGAQLWRLDADGTETLIALYDSDAPAWRKVGGDDA